MRIYLHLLCKSMGWFLYDKDLRHERFKYICSSYINHYWNMAQMKTVMLVERNFILWTHRTINSNFFAAQDITTVLFSSASIFTEYITLFTLTRHFLVILANAFKLHVDRINLTDFTDGETNPVFTIDINLVKYAGIRVFSDHKVTIKNANFFVTIISCLRAHQRKKFTMNS